MSESLFEQVATSITVEQLQSPLGMTLDANAHMQGALEEIYEACEADGTDPYDQICIVKDGSAIIGWLDLTDPTSPGEPVRFDYEAESVGSFAEPFTANHFITADMPALQAVKLFSEDVPEFYFVLKGNEIVGNLFWVSFFKPPFQLCLFTLTLELEREAHRLLLTNPHAAWASLPTGRQDRARAIYELRTKHVPKGEPVSALLGCTMFCDKGTMLGKLGWIPGGRKSAESLFAKAQSVRDKCAHTGPGNDGLLLTKAELGSFVSLYSGLSETLRNARTAAWLAKRDKAEPGAE